MYRRIANNSYKMTILEFIRYVNYRILESVRLNRRFVRSEIRMQVGSPIDNFVPVFIRPSGTSLVLSAEEERLVHTDALPVN